MFSLIPHWYFLVLGIAFIVMILMGGFKECFLVLIWAIAISLVIICSNSHAMSFQRAKNLFSHLENVSGYHVQLKLDPDSDFNAWTSSPYSITITQGLLNFCNDAQMISVMGHELGHIDHQDFRKHKSSFNAEMLADLNGDYYCNKMNYSKKDCISYLRKALKTEGEGGGDGIHPSWSQRINNILKHRK
jgi:hypothetical protein